MRWILSTVLILIATPVFAQENEAEKLFRAMEKKIKEAKSLKVVWESEREGVKSSRMSGKLHGSLQFADAGKGRVEIDLDPDRLLYVCDGKNIGIIKGKGSAKLVPAWDLRSTWTGMMCRAGASAVYILPLNVFTRSDELDPEKLIHISNFRIGKKEQVGEREIQVIEYSWKTNANKSITVQLWIDSLTFAPLKRRLHDPAFPKESFFTETYTEFLINPQLDPKLFELPK